MDEQKPALLSLRVNNTYVFHKSISINTGAAVSSYRTAIVSFFSSFGFPLRCIIFSMNYTCEQPSHSPTAIRLAKCEIRRPFISTTFTQCLTCSRLMAALRQQPKWPTFDSSFSFFQTSDKVWDVAPFTNTSVSMSERGNRKPRLFLASESTETARHKRPRQGKGKTKETKFPLAPKQTIVFWPAAWPFEGGQEQRHPSQSSATFAHQSTHRRSPVATNFITFDLNPWGSYFSPGSASKSRSTCWWAQNAELIFISKILERKVKANEPFRAAAVASWVCRFLF